MAIKPICDKCKKELNSFGGILLSPPDKNNNVKKFHLCESCYKKIINSFKAL
ncbi:hypothetical protein L6307_04805 [Candidatus Parcubacteria bacterium]|nr:hypothetical protein [Candidatus Parcubacteria bacterium]